MDINRLMSGAREGGAAVQDMELTVERILQGGVLTCAAHVPVHEVARRMNDSRCSSIVIVDEDEHPIGIWTEADALRLDFTDPAGFDRPISDVMSTPVKTIPRHTPLDDVGVRLKHEGVRHFLVVEPNGDPVGVVTQTDVVLSQGVEFFLYLRDVRSALTRQLVTLAPDCPLHEAVARMHARRVDAAVVAATGNMAEGIVTERDLVRLIAQRRTDCVVGEVATRPLITVGAAATLLNARNLLREKGIRHLGVLGEDGKLLGLMSFSDILASVEYEYVIRLREALNERDQALQASQKHLKLEQRVIDATLDGIMITTSGGIIEQVNPAFTKLTGFRADEVIGKTPKVLNSGRHEDDFFTDMWDEIAREGHWQGEIWNRRKDGEAFPSWLTITAIGDDGGAASHYAAIFTDITERKQSEQRIKNLAYFDVLTGLPNRRLFNDRVAVAIANAHRHQTQMAVMFIDLDLFKRINDTLGHSIGDEVLQEVAGRLRTCVREGDTVSRMGGDEFTILMPDIGSPEDGVRLARRIVASMAEPFLIKGHELFVTTSIGIAVYPEDGDGMEMLIKNADTAMYRAKDLGRNSYQMYTAAMNARSFERLAMEGSLRQALDGGEFSLNYQVRTDVASGRVCGTEALIRWNSRQLGLVPPSDFIPLAEDLGLIGDIGGWVLREACRQAKDWVSRGVGDDLFVSVNLSAQQFRNPGLVDTVRRVLEHEGLAPHHLELELTESTVMEQVDEGARMIGRLRDMGVKVSIDDFGTGYSSLAYLKRLPIDSLKIDASFVRDLDRNADDAEIVSAMIALAHNLRLRVVAEGVETREQLEFLRQRECDEIQGYLIGRPLPAPDSEVLFGRDVLAG